MINVAYVYLRILNIQFYDGDDDDTNDFGAET